MQYKSETAAVLAAVVLMCSCLLVESAPWGEVNQRCGDQLANMLALVCEGRGYNMPFRPNRRARRQIVDECCRHSCSPSILEMYCGPDPPKTNTGTPIRKRSETYTDSSEVHVGDVTAAEFNPLLVSKQLVEIGPLKNELIVQTEKHKTTSQPTKERSYFQRMGFPALRHHRNLLRSARHERNHGQAHTKRTKSLLSGSGESTKTYQIGTVKPYFAGRVLAYHRDNHLLRGTSS